MIHNLSFFVSDNVPCTEKRLSLLCTPNPTPLPLGFSPRGLEKISVR